MANLFQSATSGVYNLKKFYQGPIRDQFNEDVPIYRGAEKAKYNWSGEEMRIPLRIRRNQGIGATSDGGTLPTIGRQSGAQAQVAAKYNYLRFGITGPMIKASQNDKGSFVRQASHELEMGYKDLMVDCNRQNSWDGTSDLARLNAGAAASTSIVIKGREDSEPALKFVDVGMQIDIYNGTTAVASGVTVNSISSGSATSATATIVLDTAVTVSANDVIVRAGSYGNEVQGILTQLDGATSTVFGLDRASYPILQGNVVDLNGAQLTLDAMQQAWNLGKQRGGAKYGAIYTDFDGLRYYQKLLTADKRYVNTMKGDGGFSSESESYLEFNGLPVVADQSCPPRIFFLPKEGIMKAVLCEMEFSDEQGTMYIAQTSADAFEVRIRHFYNLFNAHAAGSAVLVDYVSP